MSMFSTERSLGQASLTLDVSTPLIGLNRARDGSSVTRTDPSQQFMQMLRKSAYKDMLPRMTGSQGTSHVVADHHRDILADVLSRVGDRNQAAAS